MSDSLGDVLCIGLSDLEAAVNAAYKSQSDLQTRLENLQNIINTLPQSREPNLNPKQIQGIFTQLYT